MYYRNAAAAIVVYDITEEVGHSVIWKVLHIWWVWFITGLCVSSLVGVVHLWWVWVVIGGCGTSLVGVEHQW
jgi:hypothetical protein